MACSNQSNTSGLLLGQGYVSRGSLAREAGLLGCNLQVKPTMVKSTVLWFDKVLQTPSLDEKGVEELTFRAQSEERQSLYLHRLCWGHRDGGVCSAEV